MADLPDEKIMCHRTAFKKRCFDMVTKCKCQLWIEVQGLNPQTEAVVSRHACADSWMPLLTIEVAQMVRQNTASTDKVACEVKKHADESVALGAMHVQRVAVAAREAIYERLPAPNGNGQSALSHDTPHRLLTSDHDV